MKIWVKENFLKEKKSSVLSLENFIGNNKEIWSKIILISNIQELAFYLQSSELPIEKNDPAPLVKCSYQFYLNQNFFFRESFSGKYKQSWGEEQCCDCVDQNLTEAKSFMYITFWRYITQVFK